MRTTRSDGQKRREEILDAALECFAKQGVFATGIEDIRKRAKASPSSIYHLFGGIEPILLGLLERTFARLFGHLAAHVTLTTSAHAAVTMLVGAHVDWVLAHPVEARVMYQAMAAEGSRKVMVPLARTKAELLRPVVVHLQRFVAAGELPSWDPFVFDVVVLGVAHESCRRRLAGAPLDDAWMRTELPSMAWASVRDQLDKRGAVPASAGAAPSPDGKRPSKPRTPSKTRGKAAAASSSDR